MRAMVRSVTSVDAFMAAQVGDLSKLTVAKLAHEVPDSVVYALVFH